MAQPDYPARAAAGIRALQRWYVPRGGLLRLPRPAALWRTTGWWNAANALTAVIRYTRHTGDQAYAGVIKTTFTAARRQHPGFINWFFDDSAWWALAWIAAYDLTGEDRYLDAARTIFAHSQGGWDDTCGGGVWWNQERKYKNAITSELFLTMAALLHQRTPGDRDCRAWALRAWEWLRASGMIGPDGLVNDGLTAACASNGGTPWTYNQGVILGGLAALYQITGDQAYLRQGEVIADAALDALTSPPGILTEPCESSGCNGDQTQFKGIFVRYLHEFCLHSGKPAYRAFLLANAGSVWDSNRNAADQFGLRWGGPFDRADASRQASAVEVLTAAAALTAPGLSGLSCTRGSPASRSARFASGRGSEPTMIIAGIETFPLRIPFKAGTGSTVSVTDPADLPAVDSLLVKVTTDQGWEGWGEAFGLAAAPLARRAVDELIAPLCVGRDATRIAPLMREVQEKLLVFGRGGPVTCALSAVDTALWDIAGKAAGVPLHRLLGGGGADLACYASLDGYSDPSLVRAGVRQALDAGFRSIKLHEKEVPAVRAAREEAGPDVALMLDVNCAWTVHQARARAGELGEVGLKWLEEPVWPPENYEGLARLRAVCGIPIAAGENVATLMDFDRLMTAGAVDFVQPSPAKMGGVTELCKVFHAAALRNVTVMPHTFYDGPGLLAAIHATAALGTADAMIEWRHFDLEARIYGDALAPARGRIRVPQGPGLGIDPDPGVLRAYRRA